MSDQANLRDTESSSPEATPASAAPSPSRSREKAQTSQSPTSQKKKPKLSGYTNSLRTQEDNAYSSQATCGMKAPASHSSMPPLKPSVTASTPSSSTPEPNANDNPTP